MDKDKNILHFQNDRWISYPIKRLVSGFEIRKILPIYVEKDRIIILSTDIDWETHISEINNGKIIHYTYIAPYPLLQLTKISDALYISGNFGLLIKLENNQCNRLSSPIQSHINVTELDRSL